MVFKIAIERYEPADFEAVISERSFHEIFHYDTHLLGYHEVGYMELQKYMQPSLGPAELDDSVEGHCLEFHPLEPLPVKARMKMTKRTKSMTEINRLLRDEIILNQI